MSAKTRIVAALGERRLLVPVLLNQALAANDRAKYHLTLLQSARAHAEHPAEAFSSLRTERLACGITDPSFDEVVAGAAKGEGNRYVLPHTRRLCAELGSNLQEMITPFETTGKPEAERFRRRLEVLSATPWCGDDDTITGPVIASLASGDPTRGDSVHLLIMDMHKALNKLQAGIATTVVEGALTYGLSKDDHPLVVAFMKGVNRTRSLKFDHPGLDTTATRAGGKLILQNDIGTTDVHVLVVHLEGMAVTVTCTDNHLPRLLFFREMFSGWEVAWGDVHSRTDKAFEDEVYHLGVGIYSARNKADLKVFLSHLGSRLVFLIDWNRARKRLQTLVPRQDAVALLAWSAENNLGHMAFLKAGGEKIIFDALQFVAGGTLTYGTTLDELLGREAAVAYLRFVLGLCSRCLLAKRPPALIRDEARVEMYKYYHSVQQGLLDSAADHAALAVEIASGIRNALLDLSRPDILALLERNGQRAKEWERKADELVIGVRELAKRSTQAAAVRQLIEAADDITDELEEAAFHLTLLTPEEIDEEIRIPLAALARQLVEGTREYLKAIENVRGIDRSGSPDDMHDFLAAIHRIVAIEQQSDTTERAVRKALVGYARDYRQAFVIAECAKKLESAADALMHTGMILRDQVLGKVMER
jgi:uncharacterized protein Yka (UPF0111/DUF47 family)